MTSPMFTKANCGRFRVALYMLDKHPDTVARVLTGMVVVQIDFNYAQGFVLYTAIGPMFASVEPGQHIPAYDCMIAMDDSSDFAITWRKQ